jgi:tellurite resistance protein TerC
MIWGIFVLFILFLLLLDLGVFHKGNTIMTTKEATVWTLIWIMLSMCFNVFIYFGYTHHWFGLGETVGDKITGDQAALYFFTGYLLEKSLSIDNIFVMALIFSYFKIQEKFQHRILFWGIVGALVFRSIMIALGIELIHKFNWMLVVLGGILIYSAAKMIFGGDEEENISESFVVRTLNKFVKVNIDAPQKFFFYRKAGQLFITGSFLALIVIEVTDLLFALDSIPAIIAITTDNFIVFTSNILAILGLRSLYFVLASSLNDFKYLKTSLAFILLFVGIKMMLHYAKEIGWVSFDIPITLSLLFIVLCLTGGVLLSIMHKNKEEAEVKK